MLLLISFEIFGERQLPILGMYVSTPEDGICQPRGLQNEETAKLPKGPRLPKDIDALGLK